ncbi:MAG TPA: TIM barrel protein [Chloroflexota bacterium]|nr:TIM barrel protein [Chloroflexota bacterium]
MGNEDRICYEANAHYLPGELPWDERLRRIAEAGFSTVEILFPQRHDLDELESLLRRYRLRLALIDTESDPEYPRGHLSAPDAEERFWFRMNEALAICRRLGARRINVLAGRHLPGLPPAQQRDVAVERLRRAGARAADDGIMLLIEALNDLDNPGYFVSRSSEGIALIDAVGLPNVRFQHDFYHLQVMEGRLIDTFRANVGKIGHLQVGDAPGRVMPGLGEINLANVLQVVEASSYRGYVGLEYRPPEDGSDPFAWLPREKRGRILKE